MFRFIHHHNESYDINKAKLEDEAHFPDWYRWSAKQKWQHERDANMCVMMMNRLRARGALMRQCNPVIMDAGERIHE